MTTNIGTMDRVLRLILGIVLLVAPFVGGMAIFDSTAAIAVSVIAGIILIATSAMKFCPLYRIFGIRTCQL
ncbi:YgaP family membrane protein [Roseovarius sp. D0-M9]|uniref:YgaP family membrane protein n=1 Tax=Roseovarius sp. D0-M9 TaxID=3127117 RepID=UPI003010606D